MKSKNNIEEITYNKINNLNKRSRMYSKRLRTSISLSLLAFLTTSIYSLFEHLNYYFVSSNDSLIFFFTLLGLTSFLISFMFLQYNKRKNSKLMKAKFNILLMIESWKNLEGLMEKTLLENEVKFKPGAIREYSKKLKSLNVIDDTDMLKLQFLLKERNHIIHEGDYYIDKEEFNSYMKILEGIKNKLDNSIITTNQA